MISSLAGSWRASRQVPAIPPAWTDFPPFVGCRRLRPRRELARQPRRRSAASRVYGYPFV